MDGTIDAIAEDLCLAVRSGRLQASAARPCGQADAFGAAAFFIDDGLGIDQPLAIAGAAHLFLFVAREAPQAQEPANFGARGVHFRCGLLRR